MGRSATRACLSPGLRLRRAALYATQVRRLAHAESPVSALPLVIWKTDPRIANHRIRFLREARSPLPYAERLGAGRPPGWRGDVDGDHRHGQRFSLLPNLPRSETPCGFERG